FLAANQNYPNGCYVVEVEVDPETGGVRLDRVTAVDDVGMVVNPLLFEGQVHGALVQGLGQALMEGVEYVDGQLVSGSFSTTRCHALPISLISRLPCATFPRAQTRLASREAVKLARLAHRQRSLPQS